MSWTNFHSHSHYCDGKYEIRAHIESALDRGFIAWGCSSHMPVPFPSTWNMKVERLAAYQTEISRLREEFADRIQIYCGLEMDYIPEIAGSFNDQLKGAELDYTIGSIHYVDAFENGKAWEIDGPHSLFLKGLNEIFKENIQAAVTRYFELTRQMIREDCPDVVGHLDKIKMQNEGGQLFTEDEAWYRAEILKTLDEIQRADIITEVNTRGIYKKAVTETYPSRWVLEIMKDREMPIMLNSDSHLPQEVDGNFFETAGMLSEIGFTHLNILWDGEWVEVPFSTDGVSVKPAS